VSRALLEYEEEEPEYEEEEDDWGIKAIDHVGPNGLRVMAEQCSTCIFRPGNLMRLHPGRVKGMVEQVVADDSFTTCHQTLGGEHPPALCKGMTERHAGQLVRIFQRLDRIDRVQPPSKVAIGDER
jgi:hypothetical protein